MGVVSSYNKGAEAHLLTANRRRVGRDRCNYNLKRTPTVLILEHLTRLVDLAAGGTLGTIILFRRSTAESRQI